MNYLRRNSKLFLVIVILILFLGNYHICEYFYSDNVEGWWRLKINIYAIIVALAFFLSGIGARGTLRFITDLGAGFATASVIDRLYYDITTITKSDVIMVLVTILIATLDYKKEKPNANTTRIIRDH